MNGPRGYVCPLVNVDQGQYIRHRVHRDVQSKEVESGGTGWHIDVTKEVQTCPVGEHICLKTVISDSVLLPEPSCHTLVTCSKHCHLEIEFALSINPLRSSCKK